MNFEVSNHKAGRRECARPAGSVSGALVLPLPLPLALAVVLGLGIACAPGSAAPPPDPGRFSFRAGECFAFLGDQMTSEGSYAQFVENFFLTRYPDRAAVFLNAGCANDTVADALERLQSEVIDPGVNYLFILLGTWDGGLAPHSETRFRAFRENYGELLDRLDRTGVRPYLVSPPMFDEVAREQRLGDESFRFRDCPAAPFYNGVMALYATWLREEAVRRGLPFIDVWGPLNACSSHERRVNSTFSLMPDALEPDAGGHAVVAAAIVASLGVDRDCLGQISLEFAAGNPGWKVREARNGSLAQLQGNEEQLSFAWRAQSLPWTFPDYAMIGVQLARAEQRFNREILQVIGLRAGDYELFVGGERLPGTLSPQELARGLELDRQPGTPDREQSRRLVEANAQRHAETVLPLRAHWQTLKRTRQGFPGDDARYLQAAAGLAPRMAALRQEARERLSALYLQAKPRARMFELRRIPEPEPGSAAPPARRR